MKPNVPSLLTLVDAEDKALTSHIHHTFRFHRSVVLYFVTHFCHAELRILALEFKATSRDLNGHSGTHMIGFSGTLREGVNPIELELRRQPEIDAKIMTMLSRRENAHVVVIRATDTADDILSELKATLMRNGVRALMDVAGWMRGKSNFDVAAFLLDELPDLKGVRFFEDAQADCQIASSPATSSGCSRRLRCVAAV